MKTYTYILPYIEGNDYETHFWNAIRGKQGHKEQLVKGIDTATVNANETVTFTFKNGIEITEQM